VSRWLGSAEGLSDVAARLLEVQIENRPAIDLIRTYDADGTLFYVDPPYLHETRGDTKNYSFEMSLEDHRALAEALQAVRGKVVLSGYRHELMEDMFEGWFRIDAPSKLCHASKKARTEAVWCNFDPEGTQDAAA
jgi:DNA adenine methylase